METGCKRAGLTCRAFNRRNGHECERSSGAFCLCASCFSRMIESTLMLIMPDSFLTKPEYYAFASDGQRNRGCLVVSSLLGHLADIYAPSPEADVHRDAEERRVASGEFNYQLKRIWNEVRSSVKKAGKNVEARRSIWRRIAVEARRAATQEPRSATPLRQPFPGRMPDKPARRTHKGRTQEKRSGRGRR